MLALFSQGTDYGNFLSNEPAPLSTKTIAEYATKKLVDEFRFIRSQAIEPLATFLDYLTYPYMIDNLVLLITGTLHDRDISELIDKCHPLGLFDSMASLCIATTPEELYREIVVDTPLAPYFAECVSLDDLTDINIEIIRNTLYKSYLEDFYKLCKSMGGATSELMSEILEFEADRRAINITLNSFGTELTRDEREKLYPTIGLLFPEGIGRLARAEDAQAVGSAIEPYGTYRKLFQTAADDINKSLEDAFFEQEVHLCKLTFEMQFHYSIFYSYLRLKEQEVRNILWISEVSAATRNPAAGLNAFISTASPVSDKTDFDLAFFCSFLISLRATVYLSKAETTNQQLRELCLCVEVYHAASQSPSAFSQIRDHLSALLTKFPLTSSCKA